MSEPPLLAVRHLDAFYGDFQALFDLSVDVQAGEAVAVVGANGAGKSTLLSSIAGLIRTRRDAVTFDGAAIGGTPAPPLPRAVSRSCPKAERSFPR